MSENKTCLRCGVPLDDELTECPYCGLKYINLGKIDGEPFAMSFEDRDGFIYNCIAKLSNIDLTLSSETIYGLATTTSMDVQANMDFNLLLHDNCYYSIAFPKE